MVFAERKEVISGGNFHGEYPAKVLTHIAYYCVLKSEGSWFQGLKTFIYNVVGTSLIRTPPAVPK